MYVQTYIFIKSLLLNFLLFFPCIQASGTHLAVGTRLLTGLVVVLSDDGLQTVNIQGPTEMTSVMSLLRWNPSSPHYFVAACGGLV